MADAERIWLEPECCAEPGVGRTWCSVNEWACCPAGECDAPKPTEYVRADLVEAREAAAAEAMREACALIADAAAGKLAAAISGEWGYADSSAARARYYGRKHEAESIAAAIRARGKEGQR